MNNDLNAKRERLAEAVNQTIFFQYITEYSENPRYDEISINLAENINEFNGYVDYKDKIYQIVFNLRSLENGCSIFKTAYHEITHVLDFQSYEKRGVDIDEMIKNPQSSHRLLSEIHARYRGNKKYHQLISENQDYPFDIEMKNFKEIVKEENLLYHLFNDLGRILFCSAVFDEFTIEDGAKIISGSLLLPEISKQSIQYLKNIEGYIKNNDREEKLKSLDEKIEITETFIKDIYDCYFK